MLPSPPSAASTISFSFGGQSIAAGNNIWFTNVMTVGAIGSSPVTVFVRSATIQFTASGKIYNLAVPDGNLVYSSSVTTATTSYDSVNKLWTTYVPAGYGNPVFLSGLAFPVPAGGLPGNINPVSWTGSFCSDNASASLVWKWAAAVYTSFNSNYNSLGVKSDAIATGQYNNSDPAGTPENYKTKVVAGATGNGSSFVGGYSGTQAVTSCLMYNPPIANAGPGQTVALGSTVQLNGTGSTDPEGNPLTYSWTFVSKPAGSSAVLSGATSSTPTFVLDTFGNYTVQLIVNDGKSSSAPATVVINTKNTAPVANAGPAQSVPTQTKVQLDGSHSTDVDGDPLTYQWSFVSVPTGSTASLSNPAIVNPTFVTDKVGNYVVQLIVNDGQQNSSPSQVTITDSFVPPTANAGPNQTVEVESTVQLDGSHSTDLQGYPLTYNWSILSTPPGSTAALSDPHAVKPTFKADLLGNYIIQLIVNDGVANSAATTVTISTNDVAPVANPGQAQTVTVGTVVTLDGTQSTDSDGQPLTYSWSMTTKPSGSNATLVSPTSAKPSFRADLPGTYVIQLIVNDGFLNSQPSTVTISTNDVAPVANPGANQTVIAGATVQLDGTGSTDSDSQPLTYSWAILSQPSGGTATLSSATAAKPTFVASLAGTYVVQLIVNDGYLNSQPATVTITANPPNQPPTVSAGPNQTIVLPVNSVTLNGSASSVQPPNSPVTVQWTQVSGPGTVTFANATQAVTHASFPSAGTYVVQLTGTVTATGLSSSAQATITVSLPPPPVANAGPSQSAIVNSTVQLDGTASLDPSNLPLSYFWSLTSVPSGSTAVLSGATSAKPTFVPDLLGVYQVQLVVNNGFENSVPATTQVTVNDQAPVANAGPNQTVTIGSTVTLNGSGSTDVDGHPLTYQWSITTAPQGSTSALANTTSVTPTFAVDRVGNYTIQLVVNDGFLNSQPATVTISTNDVAPVAKAGPNQTVLVGATVQLDGSGSTDVDSNPLTYSWSFIGVPQGSSASLSSASAVQPTFVADRVGNYVVQLIVNDGFLSSPAATVTISTNDVAPVSVPGPNQTVTAGTQVTLDGSGSTDSDGLPLSYQWAMLSKPTGSTATLTSANTATTTFTADLPGNYVVQLIVNDGYLSSSPATDMISTNDVAPVANPGPNQTVAAGTIVQLDGTGSTSSLSFALTYKWAILSQPTGGNATLSDPAAPKPTFVPNVAGLYVVQLIVNDGYLDSQPQTMTVTANQSNQPPTVSAGPNQTIELPVNTATLNGSASSSAPAGSPVTVQWTQVSGPGTVTFANATQPVTQATFPGVGTYVLQLSATVTPTGLSNSAQTTVTVAPVNQPPVVTVGPDQTITYPTNTASLTGTATDDGLPVGSTLQISWAKVLGPGTVTFSNPAQPNTQATFSVPGNYAVQLSASDGQYTSSATLHVTYAASAGGGISVSAGPDQVIVFPAAATLSGAASDSNPALAGALTTVWSMASGPGTVTFANPASVATTATFSTSGVYDLRLTATDGLFTASSDVKIYAGNIQCTLSNKGTDFWLMFTGIVYTETASTPPDPPRQLQFFISSDVATSGTVSVPGQGLNLPFSVTPGQITTVNLPQSVQVTTSDTIETKGIHVTAQNPVAVYGLNFVPYATDGYLGLPTNTLGTSYIIASYRNTTYFGSDGWGTEFGVTATQDNTTVTIIPTTDGGQIDAGHPSGTRPAQQPFTILLNQGQTYQLRNSQEDSQLSLTSTTGPPVDFTGTVVTSDKPVAVFGAHDDTFVPDQTLYSNGLVEQLPPTNLWGQNFVTMPLSLERNGDRFRFVAQSDSTHVQVNHQTVAVLAKGQFFEQLIQGPAEISADNPILAVQYALSDIAGGGGNVDPTMIVVPPFEQFGGSYTINTPTSGWFPTNYINVVAPTLAAQSGGVLLDGAPLPATVFQPIGTSPFSGAQILVTIGAHTLTAGLPFGVWVYGFKLTDAYGYPGGVCFSRGVAGSTVTASPKSSTNQITKQVTIQATALDSGGQPIGGTGVTFTVTGINPQTSYATTDANGLATFSYTSFKTGSDLITVSAGTASDTSSLTWVSNGPNQPPVVSAGPNQTISLPTNTATLNGSVVDDGLPIGGTLTSTWTQLSGPAPVSFSTPNQPLTSASFPQAGSYVLQLTGNDSQLSTSAGITITVLPPDQPPVVSAGANHAFLWFQPSAVQLVGSATSPVGNTLMSQWSEVTGSDIITFDTPNKTTTFATFPSPGTYVVQLSANDTQFTTTSRATIQAYGPIAVNLGPNLQTTVGTPVTINASVLVNHQPPTPAMPLLLQWRVSAEPTGSHVTLGSPNTAVTTATFDTPGTYQLALITADSNAPQSGQQNGPVIVNVVAANTPIPNVSLSAPLDGAQLTAPTVVTGSVDSGTWTLDYALKDDFNPMTFTTLATGTSAVANATLATFDPTILLNGTYVIRLTSVNAAAQFATTSITVSVARNMKVGVFSLSFNDLTVPVSGIPIQIIRSYDSRDKGQGDFGVGWRLSLANIRVQKSRNLGLNWQETQIMSGFIPQYCLFATDNKVVTVTFPDGRVFTFQTGGNQQCQQIGQITTGTLTFTELPGAANTAGATLTPADGGQFVVDGSVPGGVNLLGFDGNPYNPTKFVLQTADGTKFTVDQKLGLTAVTDTNGNTLTITPNGIVSSAGKSVPFTRDTQGRITRITDPNGNNLVYSYNTTGDLGGFNDRAGHPMAYAYDNNHDLTGITTADGKQVLTNAFDSSGRLTSTEDAFGFFGKVTFTHNIPAQTETVTDRNGNPTTYVYDTDGNVTQVTDALNHVTTSTYDASDNKLSETNALTKTSNYTYDNNGNRLTETDPLQHKTAYTYSALSKPLTIQDANGHTTTNTYDANGNLLTTTDPNGKTTTNTYANNGLLLTTQDPLGKTTSFTYDGTGNLSTQTDANGTVSSYGYDGNGNRTSQSVTRTLSDGVTKQTLTTGYTYDGNGKLLKTTYPDNSTTQTVYNILGQQVTTIDALSRQTTYQYDADGRVTLTTYPDNTTESAAYDRNGNRTRLIDRTNVTTTYTYDALNRLTQSLRGSGFPTINKTSYDAIGQVLTTTDPNNNVTTYAYDDAGRRKQVTNALTQITTFVYDAAGNQTSFQDANNNTTTYAYDNANRRTQVTYPDSKFETTTYDALGRVTARTDANGKTTQYGYDAIGRLTSVTDALNQVTQYAYDEVGNRITQTDANTHTTSYAYDQRGRRLQRTLPLGQTESYTYDAAGNLKTRTDFNGRTTTYAYDNVNRLLSKTADAYFAQNHIGAASVTYTYDQFGRRHTMTDASGTTSWSSYDNNGHAQQVTRPAGGLSYSFDVAGNLTSIGGQSQAKYFYDALNRVAAVTTQIGNTQVTVAAYGYDNVGNLQTVTYANGVAHNYGYDTRNRLTNLGVAKGSGNLFGYTYTLDAAGHRTGVTELSGRTVSYGYDSIYRLTSETIASDPSAVNGAASYVYDPVGNRTQKTSTIPGYPGGLTNYNANDQIGTDSYDNDGNTTGSNGVGYVYDFENRLVQAGGGISIVYDGDGNRVSKTVAGLTTTYLVDDQNPTGYSQVVYESTAGSSAPNREVSHTFAYGLERTLEQRVYLAGGNFFTQTIYFVYDGHGSVRALTDQSGNVTDTYDYDAFGNLLHSTGTTLNNYRFAGEQFDPDLGLYFNRARYLNVSTGRFWTADLFEGVVSDPFSLHRYLYASANPTGFIDPSGFETLVEVEVQLPASETVATTTTVSAQAASTAEIAAESVAVAAQAKGSLAAAILLLIAVGTAVQLKGDNQPGPRANPKNNDNSSNRGRLQAQGQDILEGQPYNVAGHEGFTASKDTVSWSWSQLNPLDVYTANSKLSEFLEILTPVQIGRRRDAFYRASRFINNTAMTGGVHAPIYIPPFNARDPRYPDARVDIEVNAGWAFVPVP
jgi:RHS repeat-associated protein